MVSYQTLINQISAGNYAPVYLFYGEEKYLQEELVASLSCSFLGEDADFGKEKVAGALLSAEEIANRLSQAGLFTQRRLLIIDNPPYLSAPQKNVDLKKVESNSEENLSEKDYADLINDYLDQQESSVPTTILIFVVSRVDRRKRIYKIIDQKAVTVECNPLKGEALASWIRSKVNCLGKKIDRSALERLLLAGEQNLHYLSGELEKYSAYLGDKQNVITAEIVDLLFSGDIQGDVFKMADAIAGNNAVRANDYLELLLRRREKPLQIFFMLVRHYRLLLQAHCLLEEGLPASEFASALGVHPFAARKLKEQAGKCGRTALEDVLITLQKTDLEIKTGRTDPIQALKLVISRIDYLQSTARYGLK